MQARERTVEKLSVLLASSYSLALKTQHYHWNVADPSFINLHSLFEAQYAALTGAVDELAERIRALGARTPKSYSECAQLTLVEEDRTGPAAPVMLEVLAGDHATLALTAQELLRAASVYCDDATADLATRRLSEHEKDVWYLRSHLKSPMSLMSASTSH